MTDLERQHYDRLDQRMKYLAKRINAKKEMQWEFCHDQTEHDALQWALNKLDLRSEGEKFREAEWK